MLMELYLANVALICGIVFSVAGYIMYKWPPKEINGLYGYRTGSSMKSQEQWDFAQVYAAKQMIKCGVAMIVTGLLMAVFSVQVEIIAGIGMLMLFVVTSYMIYSTEQAIKKQVKK
jgi:uncharacterized membrane protein